MDTQNALLKKISYSYLTVDASWRTFQSLKTLVAKLATHKNLVLMDYTLLWSQFNNQPTLQYCQCCRLLSIQQSAHLTVMSIL